MSITDAMLAYFETKGRGAKATGRNLNAVKVRRVVQLVQDLAGPISGRRVLDLACGEGVYSIELALAGANVLAVDARMDRMGQGITYAEELGLCNLDFVLDDVRNIKAEEFGHFDVVLFLGMLYHLSAADACATLARLYEMCDRLLIVDTFIVGAGKDVVSHDGHEYRGVHRPEGKGIMSAVDESRVFVWQLTSLVQFLQRIGFPTVLQCHAPLYHNMPADRVTLAALKTTPARIATYPWINEASEDSMAGQIDPHYVRGGKKHGKK